MDSVPLHYRHERLEEIVLAALKDAGKDLGCLTPDDLAPVDEFHIRGRAATEELGRLGAIGEGHDLLDVGCGLGGSCRYLAGTFRCRATGLDVTPEYVRLAERLTSLVGLENEVAFRAGSALELPFDDRTFDRVWTEHVQMNVEDKPGFYREIFRVLRRGGRLIFHDILAGSGGEPHYPVPWARDGNISFLIPPSELRALLTGLGFELLHWVDQSSASREWSRKALARLQSQGRPPLGVHLLMGYDAFEKFGNLARSLEEGRIAVYQAVAEKP